MSLSSKILVKTLLKTNGIRPIKQLGQNFLIDKIAVRKIIKAADLKSEETVLEIGPGLGVLTLELAKRVKKVIAVEKDRRIVELLNKTMKGFGDIKIIHGDILKIEPPTKILARGKIGDFKVVANLPFYLTAPVIPRYEFISCLGTALCSAKNRRLYF
jgi:16S rRNA (adenine1518-N6/adenine1519-N6)-dimethyltransferase